MESPEVGRCLEQFDPVVRWLLGSSFSGFVVHSVSLVWRQDSLHDYGMAAGVKQSLSFPYSHSSEETLCPVTQLLDKNTRLCVEWDAQTSMGWGSYHILIALDLGYWNLSWDLFNPIGFHFRTIRRVNSTQIRSFSTMGTKWNGWPEIVQCPFIMLHKNISQ